MALKPCKECGVNVSTHAKTCPCCGAPVRFTIKLWHIFLVFLLVSVFTTSVNRYNEVKSSITEKNEQTNVQPAYSAGCREHIELHSAEVLAKEYGQPALWIQGNIKINLWEKPTSKGKGAQIGALLPGSRALIINTKSGDYKVISPLDGSVGWINKTQVARTLYQDTETRESCNP